MGHQHVLLPLLPLLPPYRVVGVVGVLVVWSHGSSLGVRWEYGSNRTAPIWWTMNSVRVRGWEYLEAFSGANGRYHAGLIPRDRRASTTAATALLDDRGLP
jgi:hypothetical protein